MTARTLGDLVIYAGGVAGALGAIGVLLRYLVVRPLQAWISEQAARDVIEQTSRQVVAVSRQLDDIAVRVDQNAEVANEALTIARETSARLDRHLIDHHHYTEG